jgi:sulfur-carrier protein adenylyltransferase/sulfurtransferase
MLQGHGFKYVYNVAGGIRAWYGDVAHGPVELNLDLVRGDETPLEIIKLAYSMEESLGGFYRAVNKASDDSKMTKLLEFLISIEDMHKARLMEFYRSVEPSGPPVEIFEAEVKASIMEGGFDAQTFMRQNAESLRTVPETLDLCMMLEAQALDLYLRFSFKSESEQTKDVLNRIAEEEKKHLAALGRLREQKR